MKKAKKLLLETDIPVTEIAYLTGYRSGAHFSDAFRKMVGYSPNQLRRNGDIGR